ncbi:MAG: ABC-type transport auxiliary lipoprotein family protein [Campylobacterota bacterium]|nr:ABC-type transport auxiliary lipoprotein family protein [Campylobacterota bacterium]
MIKLIIISIVTFLFIGCSTTVPAVAEYRINTLSPDTAFNESGCKKQSLKIAQAFSSSSLMSNKMSYGLGTHKQYKFTESQWAESPNRAISAAVLEYVKSTELFNSVQISKSRSKNGLLMETNIEEFMQYFSADEKESLVRAKINLTLIDAQASKVLASKTFTSEVEVEELNADKGVIALNRALQNILEESGEWLSGVCR